MPSHIIKYKEQTKIKWKYFLNYKLNRIENELTVTREKQKENKYCYVHYEQMNMLIRNIQIQIDKWRK